MLGSGPQACLAPLPYTLSKTFNVVFGHDSLRCDRQALKRRTMVKERANRTGNEDMATLRRAVRCPSDDVNALPLPRNVRNRQ